MNSPQTIPAQDAPVLPLLSAADRAFLDWLSAAIAETLINQ